MKVKTSIVIDADALAAIGRIASRSRSRSCVIEEAARAFLIRRARGRREACDLAILNRVADDLSREMADVLGYRRPA
jgi:hypothetical protein